jgi:hypothetical protein
MLFMVMTVLQEHMIRVYRRDSQRAPCYSLTIYPNPLASSQQISRQYRRYTSANILINIRYIVQSCLLVSKLDTCRISCDINIVMDIISECKIFIYTVCQDIHLPVSTLNLFLLLF